MSAPPATPGWLVPFSIVMTLVAGLGGMSGLATLLLVRRQGRKVSADTTHVLTSAAVALVSPLERRLETAESDLLSTRIRLRTIERRLDALVTAILDPMATLEALRHMARRANGDTPAGGDNGG